MRYPRSQRNSTGLADPYRMVHQARRDGLLKPGPCERCGKSEAQAHHDDYARPLAVRWLCRRCHKAWHREHGPGLNRHLIVPVPPVRNIEPLMTPSDLLAYLIEKGLPILKAGSLIRIRKAELDAWLERERVA